MEWFNVKDEMPNSNGEYLVLFASERMAVADYCTGDDGFWSSNGEEYSKITHWMELPDLPLIKE